MNAVDSIAKALARLVVGDEILTFHGNRLKRFKEGWSPLSGSHWGRGTVYSNREVAENFILESEEQNGKVADR